MASVKPKFSSSSLSVAAPSLVKKRDRSSLPAFPPPSFSSSSFSPPHPPPPPPLPSSSPPITLENHHTSQEFVSRVDCPFSSEEHDGKEMVNLVLPIPPKQVYQLLFEDENFMVNIYKEKKYVDLVFSPWERNPSTGDTVRSLHCTATLPSRALGPSTSNVTEFHTLSSVSRENELYVVNIVISNGGIPYGDNFKILVHICLTKVAGEAPGHQISCRFSYFCNVRFKKNTFFLVRGVIERSAYDGIQAFAEDVASALLVEVDRMTGVETRQQSEAKLHQNTHNRLDASLAGGASGPPPPPRTWSVLLLFALLSSIALTNVYLYNELKGIEDLTRRRAALVGEEAPTPQTLLKAPALEVIEESLRRLRIQEEVMKTQFQKWKDKLALIFNAINEAETELQEIIGSLPTYETEMLNMLSLKPSTQDQTYSYKQQKH